MSILRNLLLSSCCRGLLSLPRILFLSAVSKSLYKNFNLFDSVNISTESFAVCFTNMFTY